MTGNKENTVRFSPARVKSDLVRVDEHEIAPHEFEEAPDLSDFDIADGRLEVAGVPVRRGRPTKPDRKRATTIRLDPDILDHFKASGRGWQGRINDALRRSIKA